MLVDGWWTFSSKDLDGWWTFGSKELDRSSYQGTWLIRNPDGLREVPLEVGTKTDQIWFTHRFLSLVWVLEISSIRKIFQQVS